jgi:hypothetical protein
MNCAGPLGGLFGGWRWSLRRGGDAFPGPPALGDDGIVYSAWISPDLVEVPMAASGETVEIETQSPVPPDVGAPYLLVSVEQKRERLFTGHLLDLSGVE